MIRTVIFPIKASKNKEGLAKELDLFIYERKITRDQIITIQYAVGGGGDWWDKHNIMLVYEMKDKEIDDEKGSLTL